MSETLLLAILSISELALLTTGLAVYLFMRNRRLAREKDEAEAEAEMTTPEETAPPEPQLHFADYLQQNFEQTQAKLAELSPEQATLMQTRLDFLQSEINAQKHIDEPKAYWEELMNGLAGLLPDGTAESNNAKQEDKDETPTLNELDDIDIDDPLDNIPTLKDNVGDGVRKDPTITIETANEDLERLRKIISRQHDTMDELKKSLQEKDVDLGSNQELTKKLEEIEVAQAQLNMCVETLEKENERLNELLKVYDESGSQEELIATKQELEEANERISTLEKENSQQAQRIVDLESEIAELEKTLEQRSEELARVQELEVDLSQTGDNEEHSQDSLMREIESLTELITQKSEELSKLQSESADEFDFGGALPEASADESVPEKARGAG